VVEIDPGIVGAEPDDLVEIGQGLLRIIPALRAIRAQPIRFDLARISLERRGQLPATNVGQGEA